MKQKKILIISHAHPKFSKGGGEIAAYNMYKELRKQGFDAYFLAAHFNEKAHHGYTPFSIVNEKEILFYASPMDYFINSTNDKRATWKHFREVLDMIEPEVIHFHHYMHLGLDKIREAYKYKKSNPDRDPKIILTLHEYIAICAHNGQMVKKEGDNLLGALCYESDYVDCAKCFPDRGANDFFLRESYIKSYFDLVDHFVSPSHFLVDRYVDWGIAPEKISMLENGQVYPDKLKRGKRPLQKGERRAVFGYFGQINPFKGMDVLMDALDYLDKKTLKHFRLHIHGTGMEMWGEEFKGKVRSHFEKYKENVTYFGRYEAEELPEFMAEVDWVIIPSSWWENSPLVIQESFKFGKPMIASDIGGMAEKITDGKDGLHFKVRNARSLAEKLTQAISDAELYDTLYDGVSEPLSIGDSVKEHLEVYSKKDSK